MAGVHAGRRDPGRGGSGPPEPPSTAPPLRGGPPPGLRPPLQAGSAVRCPPGSTRPCQTRRPNHWDESSRLGAEELRHLLLGGDASARPTASAQAEQPSGRRGCRSSRDTGHRTTGRAASFNAPANKRCIVRNLDNHQQALRNLLCETQHDTQQHSTTHNTQQN